MIKGIRDLNVLSLEHLNNLRTKFCIDHSNMNVIHIDSGNEAEEEEH
jgi:hypothetical protein